MDNADNFLKYSKSFLRPIRPIIYVKLKDTLVGVPRARAEAANNALLADGGVYATAERKTSLFILWAVDNIWISEFSKGMLTYYSKVFAKMMLDHLQELCLGNHEINILVLTEKMRQMYQVFETTPQYVNLLEKAQKQAEIAEMPIADVTLVMMVTKAMLETERYPKAYNV